MALATDEELRVQVESFTMAQVRLAVLLTAREDLQMQRQVINLKLDEVTADIVAQRARTSNARLELRTLLTRP